VIGISESPTTADRHEARVPDLREDHDLHSLLRASARLGAVFPGDRSAAWRREWSSVLISSATRLLPLVAGG
jgi:hypothetical protein